MKISISIFLIFFSVCLFGQKKSDTLNNLETISKIYLRAMYQSKNFDSASKMWDKSVFLEARQFYLNEKKENLADSAIMKLFKIAYSKYYIESTEFKILELAVYSFSTPIDDSMEVRLLYHCTERIKRNLKKIRVCLYFISHDRGKNWNLQDSKTVDITKRYK